MKIKVILFAFVMLLNGFLNSYSQQDVNGWYWLNGQPAGQTLKWVNIFDASNIFAVGGRGIFMKSADGGDTWSVNNTAGSPDNTPGTGGLARRDLNTGWFFNGSTGYVAGQSLSVITGYPVPKGYISRTTDGGNTFSYVEYNDTGGTVNSIYFINANTGYLTGSGKARFFKTTDGGLTWQDQSFSPILPSTSNNAVFALDTSNIFIASNTSRKIYYHKPGGDSAWKVWTLPGTAATPTDIYFKDANTGYVSGNGNYFAYTTDGGTTWTQSNPPSTVGQRKIKYVTSTSTLYLAGAYTEIYKSTNDGVSWTAINFFDGSNVNQPASSIIYGLDINGNDWAVVGQNGIVNLSNDNGASWRNKNYAVAPANVFYQSMFVESPTGKIWLGASGTMLYSTNGGTNWSTQTTSHGYSILATQMINSQTGWIGGGSASFAVSELSKTTDGGVTWVLQSPPSPINTYQFNTINFVDVNTGWIGGIKSPFTPALVAKTTDGGVTWTQQTLQGSPNGGITSIQMTNANTGYAVGSQTGGLWFTSDGGANWIKNTSSPVSSMGFSNMFVLNKDVLFLNGSGNNGAVDTMNTIMRSTDAGATWVDVSTGLGSLQSLTIFRTKWLNINDGVVSTAGGTMSRTTNGGLNWTSTNPGFSTTVDVSYPNRNVWFTISDRNGNYQVARKYETSTLISANLYIGIEGFWNGTTQVSDVVTAELRSSTSPYNLVATANATLTTGVGYGYFQFPGAPAGSYYIVVKHRNSMETWSAAPVAMTAGGNYNYDFTSAATQAYGSNMALTFGRYCNYSGDINQDNAIDGSDLSLGDNAALVGLSGYVTEDVTGDNFVDAQDLSVIDNNVTLGVLIAKP